MFHNPDQLYSDRHSVLTDLKNSGYQYSVPDMLIQNMDSVLNYSGCYQYSYMNRSCQYQLSVHNYNCYMSLNHSYYSAEYYQHYTGLQNLQYLQCRQYQLYMLYLQYQLHLMCNLTDYNQLPAVQTLYLLYQLLLVRKMRLIVNCREMPFQLYAFSFIWKMKWLSKCLSQIFFF